MKMNKEKICPVMSMPTSIVHPPRSIFGLFPKPRHSLNYPPLLNDFATCQHEKCYKYASCTKKEYDGLIAMELPDKAYALKEEFRMRIGDTDEFSKRKSE
jgi:hypothetical protein